VDIDSSAKINSIFEIIMRVLVVGSGPVGHAIARKIIANYPFVELSVSDFNKEERLTQSLFGPSTFYYRKGKAGLGKFWHGVMDVDLVKSLGKIESNSYFSDFNRMKTDRMEFVPFIVPRFSINVKMLGPLSEITRVEKGFTEVSMCSAEKLRFDYVFVATGIGATSNDPLINSGIAVPSKTYSDHLIFNSREWVRGTVDVKRKLNGHYRSYDIIKYKDFELKRSFRPALSSSIVDPKNKAIYASSKVDMFKKMLGGAMLPILASSIHLRYGVPPMTKKGFYFYQLRVPDLYAFQDKGLVLKSNILQQDSFREMLEALKIDSSTILSGIHLHDGFSQVENIDNMAVNRIDVVESHRLRVVTPNLSMHADARHFTSYLMRVGELMTKNMSS
jgi:hypothetical protein